ncbi:MAG: glycosyltransferase family 2 protein [bacterium]|nr:glycosyltransferase family 2 protein [bacterium]
MTETKINSTMFKEKAAERFRPLINNVFSDMGADGDCYSACANAIISRIFSKGNWDDITLKSLYPLEISEYERWSARCGERFKWTDKGFKSSLRDDYGCEVGRGADHMALVVLFRMVFEESTEFRATCPSFRYFLFEKALKMFFGRKKKDILGEIRSDTWALLEALRPGYSKDLTKEDKITFEDIESLFRGEKKGFLADFKNMEGRLKEEKLRYLASGNPDGKIRSAANAENFLWLKTFKDKQGLKPFISNVRKLWVPLLPLLAVIFAAGIITGVDKNIFMTESSRLALFIAGILSPAVEISVPAVILFIEASICSALGVFFSLLLMRVTLGGFRFPDDKSPSLSSAGEAVRKFKALYAFSAYIWSVFSIFVVRWTVFVVKETVFKDIGWEIFIDGGAVLLTILFVLASFQSLFYVFISLLAYLQGRREGVGQIVRWSQIKVKLSEAERRFARIMRIEPGSNDKYSWRYYWNYFITDMFENYKISEEEKNRLIYSQDSDTVDLILKPGNDEAADRIKRIVNGWLMDMPGSLPWEKIPILTVLITAFNEPVSILYEELNVVEKGAVETRLNHLIGRYGRDWNEFVGRINENDLRGEISKEELKNLSGFQKLPIGISDGLKEKIRMWATLMVQPIERTVIETEKIRDAFKISARIAFPDAEDSVIDKLADDKLQILLNYEGYHKSSARDEDRVSLRKLMRKYRHLEVYWGPVEGSDYVSGSGDETVRYSKHSDCGLHKYNPDSGSIELIEKAPYAVPPKKGKPTGSSQSLSFVKGDYILFFDANASVRIEEAVKIPIAFAEFSEDSSLSEVLFSEYIYTKDYSWVAQAVGFNDETFTTVTQRAMGIFHACGFYGHSAVIKTEAITCSGGFPQDYISEDILLAVSTWLKGFRTAHRQYIYFGKGREISFYSTLAPFSKWAAGASEVGLGRIIVEILSSARMHFAQKFTLMFGFSFYYHLPLVLIINFIYMWFMVCWGVNAFISVPFPFIFVVLGLLFNQSITSMGLVYLIERFGIIGMPGKYLRLVGKNFFLYTAAIPSYAVGFIKGLIGKFKPSISSKGWNLGHLSFREIWGEDRIYFNIIFATTLIGVPLLFVLVAAKILPFWISPFIALFPLAMVAILYYIGKFGVVSGIGFLKKFRDDIMPDGDFSRISAVKIQMIFSIGLVAFIGVGFVLWGVVFSSFASKLLFVLSLIYLSPPVSYIFVPVIAHSQPFAIFKEATESRLWNMLLIPMVYSGIAAAFLLINFNIIRSNLEMRIYLMIAVSFLAGWFLLKMKLSGYGSLDRWLKNNFRNYAKRNVIARSALQDDIYFRHQELLGLPREKGYEKAAYVLKILIMAGTSAVFFLDIIAELGRGYYRHWFWYIIEALIFLCLFLNIRSTGKDRNLLKDLIGAVVFEDIEKIETDSSYKEIIWGKLSERYKETLMRSYKDPETAKTFLAGFILGLRESVNAGS